MGEEVNRTDPPPRVAAVVLAAGQSRRMGDINKLLAPVNGTPMVLRAVDAALGSKADPVIVVTGHEAERVTRALGDRPVRVVHNPAYTEGIAASIRCGVAAVPDACDGAVILLGDMPEVGAAHIDRLIAAFRPRTSHGGTGHGIVVPAAGGRRGNPVLWARRYFGDLCKLSGDMGGRRLFERFADDLCTVTMGEDPAVLRDVDTPDMLDRGRMPPD